ncbi:MAG: radical SAM/SPASM domain-containing protein [Candidatus Thermoplasmatota archaeon]
MIPQSNEIRFETTTKCNYCCLPCPREKLTRKIETISFSRFKKIFDKVINETQQYDTITLSGFGEPLLDSTIEKKIRYAKSKDFDVLILSNAALLTVEKFKKLEELGVNSIRISFYGMTPKVYSLVHGTKNEKLFSKVKENLVKISEIKKTTKIVMTYNVIPGINDSDMQEWINFWKDRVDLVEVWRPHNWVYGREYRQIQNEKVNTCGRPWKTPLQIQVDGTVIMCCFDFNGDLLLGDLNTQSLEEIFSSELFKKIMHCHTTGDFKGSGLICENCDQRNKIKSDIMIYNSKFDINERVGKVSTTYRDLY